MFGWLEKHRTVALMLAAAIAGPVVVAIGAYIVEPDRHRRRRPWPRCSARRRSSRRSPSSPPASDYAYTHWGWFRDIVQAIWHWITGPCGPGSRASPPFFGTVFDDP